MVNKIFKSNKMKCLWLRIESYFNNMIGLQWSITNFYFTSFDLIQDFIHTSYDEFEHHTLTKGKVYLFTFFGIINRSIDEIDEKILKYQSSLKIPVKNLKFHPKNLDKWVKVVNAFQNTHEGKNLKKIIEKIIKMYAKETNNNLNLLKSPMFRHLYKMGKKIFVNERKIYLQFINIKNNRVLNLDKKFYYKKKN